MVRSSRQIAEDEEKGKNGDSSAKSYQKLKQEVAKRQVKGAVPKSQKRG